MKRIGLLEFDEPFAGLFTQGMVCHETYRDGAGNWLLPEQVTKGPRRQAGEHRRRRRRSRSAAPRR